MSFESFESFEPVRIVVAFGSLSDRETNVSRIDTPINRRWQSSSHRGTSGVTPGARRGKSRKCTRIRGVMIAPVTCGA